MTNKTYDPPRPIRAVDLDAFRLKHGMTIGEACHVFGLQRAAWVKLAGQPGEVIADGAVARLLVLYETYPEVIPNRRVMDFTAAMRRNGFAPDDPTDKKDYGQVALGREAAMVYRCVMGKSRPSKPVERILEAMDSIGVSSPKKRRKILEEVASEVNRRNGNREPVEKNKSE